MEREYDAILANEIKSNREENIMHIYDGTIDKKSLMIARGADDSKHQNAEISVRALAALSALALFATVAVAQQSGPRGIPVNAVNWGPAPDALPKGGELAALSGDPGKSAGSLSV